MEPNIWGPGAWTFLHSITLNYPDNPSIQDKKIYKDFFMMLPNILPCTICRDNLNKHYNELPINFALSNKETLSKWLVEIHNKSNAVDNKKIITYQEFLKIYEKKYENPNESITYFKNRLENQKKIIYILIFLFLILLIYVYFKIYKKS